MIRIAVDAMGGDRGPEEVVAGALEARTDTVVPVVVGPASLDTQGLELIQASDVIAMDEKPAEAVRSKPDSSLVVSCRAVHEGRAQAVVSAGNTGAMLAACLLEIRRLPGVRRPAIAVTIPSRDGASGGNCPARGDQRAVRLRAHRLGGLLLHRHHLGGHDVLESVRVQRARPEHDRHDPVARGLERTGDDLLRAPVAAHRVDGNPNGHARLDD